MQKFTLGHELVNRFLQCFPSSFLYFFGPTIAIQLFLYYAPPTALEALGFSKCGSQLSSSTVICSAELKRILLRESSVSVASSG